MKPRAYPFFAAWRLFPPFGSHTESKSKAAKPQSRKGGTETSGSKRSGRGLIATLAVILSRPFRAFSTTLSRIPRAKPWAGLSCPVGAGEAKTGSQRHPILPPFRLLLRGFAAWRLFPPFGSRTESKSKAAKPQSGKGANGDEQIETFRKGPHCKTRCDP